MSPAPHLFGDEERLAVRREYAVLETAPEPVFDELASLAAQLCGTPYALISLADRHRRWVKARVGLDLAIPYDASFCEHVVRQADLFVVPDAAGDARFAGVPLVAGAAGVRFYAGLPLVVPAGDMIGVLCVMDRRPRALAPAEADALRVMSRQVVAQLELRRRTLALEERERLLRTIVESEPECVKLLGPDGTLRMMNRAGLQMIEAESFEEVAGHCIYPLVSEEHRAAFRDLTARVFNGEPGSLEFGVTGLKGGSRFLETHAVPLRDEQGAVDALLGITRDITQRRRADAALHASESNFRLLFEQATDGIFVTDPDGRFLDANPAACGMIGYSPSDLAEMRVTDLIDPPEQPGVATEIARTARGIPIAGEWRLRRKDGGALICEITASRLPDGRLQGFARDVTARKRAEAALRENEDRLRRAVRAGRVGLWDWEVATNRVYFSPEWKRQIGYDDDELPDVFDEWQRRVHPADLEFMLERANAFINSDQHEFENEFRFRHRDGSYRRILAHMSKLTDSQGRTVRVLGSHVDITERAALEAQFLQAQKIESVGRLAGGIAHDFNNLLTVINGMADLAIATVRESDPLRQDLEEIRLAGERAAALTRQLLALSRQQILKPEILSLTAVVADMQSMLRRLIGENIDLVVSLAPGLGCVMADPSQIEQVILNLTVNARDAMPDGGTLTLHTHDVDVRASAGGEEQTLAPGPYVVLSVTDTGVGMDEPTRKRVFEPFFTTKAPGKGTGLGLSTVYGIVKQSGGTVSVASEPGTGTTFTIALPRVEGTPRRSQAPQPSDGARGSETILLVEDERSLRELTRRILVSAGYTVLEAGSGEDALTLLTHDDRTVHLTVTDVVMPGMNGRELAARLAESRPAMKVLFISGYTDEAILQHGVLDDASRFVAKPYSPAELRRRIRSTLDARPESPEPRGAPLAREAPPGIREV